MLKPNFNITTTTTRWQCYIIIRVTYWGDFLENIDKKQIE